jgi:hypothetical protein
MSSKSNERARARRAILPAILEGRRKGLTGRSLRAWVTTTHRSEQIRPRIWHSEVLAQLGRLGHAG